MAQYRIVWDTIKNSTVALISLLSSKEVLADYSASNYTPTAVDTEGTDKVSAHLKGIDTRISQLSGGAVTDFDVGVGGQTVFTVSGLVAESVLNVWIQGIKQREGASHAFTRQTGQITFTESVPEGSWVQVQVG